MTDSKKIERMARALREAGANLDDERAVMRALRSAAFYDGDIILHCDDAIVAARVDTLIS